MEWVQGAGGEIFLVDLYSVCGETYSRSFAVELKSLSKVADVWERENKLTN